LFTDQSGRVVGYGLGGFNTSLLPKGLSLAKGKKSGWVGNFTESPLQPVLAYGFSDDGSLLCALGALPSRPSL
jgi:hypothetical protein